MIKSKYALPSKLSQYSKKHMQLKTDKGSLPDFDKQVISIFDIEYQKGLDIDVALRVIKQYEGLGQINFNESLYLCGSKFNDISVGADFLKYDPNGNDNKIQFLINS